MNAIILAAGHSSRMIEEKQYTHKPLLPILGLPNIERTILILNDFGINDIVIIAGIYADQYTFLQEKYGCTIVSDPNCSVSTLYGIYSIVNIIGDTFIIEGDVVLAENIFINTPYSYYYVMKYLNPEVDAWKPILDKNGRIISFEIGCFSEPCILGVSFWSKSDAEIFKKIIADISTPENLSNNENFWDDYFIDFLDEIQIHTLEIPNYVASEMNNIIEYDMAITMCQKYYSNPKQYFINWHNNKNEYSYIMNTSQSLSYTKKLLEEYIYKHPDENFSLTIPSYFENNEYPYIIKKEKKIIGFIDIAIEKFFLLRRIYLDKSYRRQRLGTQILENIITFSKLANKELRVNVYDEEAEKFYKRLGLKKFYKLHNKETMSMDIIQECLAYFKNIDINFDLLIIADTQNKTTKNNNYIVHTDESEFFSRKEFAEIASTLFYIFGYAKVFYSELDFIKFVMDEHPSSTECYIYNFSRDGIAEGKKSLIPAFCDLCGLKYTGSNAFTISLLRNKWIFTQVLSNMGILTPKSVLYTFNNHNILEPFLDMTILLKNIHESASIGLLTDNKIYLTKENLKTVDMTLQRMNTKQLLIQEYISGLECEVLVIQFKGKYYALEPVEIVINGNDFLDSLTSNLYNYSFRKLSDRLSPTVIEQIKKQAVKAAQILSIKDYARFDFRIEKDQPYLIDIAGTPYTIKHSSVAFLFENIMHLDYKDIYKTIMACSFSNYDILQS